MSSSITIVGNVTRDPEMSFSQTGKAVARFAVAVNKTNKNGDKTTSFYDVVCFQSLAENIVDSIHKGDRVIVTGNADINKHEKQTGEVVTTINIMADHIGLELRWNGATANPKDAVRISKASSSVNDEPW